MQRYGIYESHAQFCSVMVISSHGQYARDLVVLVFYESCKIEIFFDWKLYAETLCMYAIARVRSILVSEAFLKFCRDALLV